MTDQNATEYKDYEHWSNYILPIILIAGLVEKVNVPLFSCGIGLVLVSKRFPYGILGSYAFFVGFAMDLGLGK